jgi:hypothetical protein
MTTSSRNLTRYCIVAPGPPPQSFGVTAASVEEAFELLATAGFPLVPAAPGLRVSENVDVSTLDADQVLPNIGLPNARGVWFPRRNL